MSNASMALPSDEVPVFDGFPYLATRIVDSLHHILLLPRSWDIDHLIAFAQKQVRANRLPACLTLTESLCIYFREDGDAWQSNNVPRSATVTSGKLEPAEPIPDSAELAIRQMKLILREEAGNEGETAYILGDLTKAGRFPTPVEEERLAGTHAGNVPKGLWPCPRCGEWRGECFDTFIRELIVRVHCVCENDNLCAGCGERLHSRKLNANHFEPADGKIWHTPAFSGFHHRCAIKKGRL